MHDEMNSLKKINTFILIELRKGKKTLKNKWVFKLRQGIDFDEISCQL